MSICGFSMFTKVSIKTTALLESAEIWVCSCEIALANGGGLRHSLAPVPTNARPTKAAITVFENKSPIECFSTEIASLTIGLRLGLETISYFVDLRNST